MSKELRAPLIAKLRKMVADYEPMEHDDLFGESPDDAYSKGVYDGERDLALLILQDIDEGE